MDPRCTLVLLYSSSFNSALRLVHVAVSEIDGQRTYVHLSYVRTPAIYTAGEMSLHKC
jgi:hypothetical protein